LSSNVNIKIRKCTVLTKWFNKYIIELQKQHPPLFWQEQQEVEKANEENREKY
jgi:hypothetical protein